MEGFRHSVRIYDVHQTSETSLKTSTLNVGPNVYRTEWYRYMFYIVVVVREKRSLKSTVLKGECGYSYNSVTVFM